MNLFIGATLDWQDRGFTVIQETRFPDADTTRLTFRGKKADTQRCGYASRRGARSMTVSVNGRRKATARQPGTYHSLERKFRPGDVVEVRMPMSLHLEPLPNAPDYAALMYGPIVLAGRMGTEGLTPGSQLIVNERESGNMLKDDVKIPRWTKPLAEMVSQHDAHERGKARVPHVRVRRRRQRDLIPGSGSLTSATTCIGAPARSRERSFPWPPARHPVLHLAGGGWARLVQPVRGSI